MRLTALVAAAAALLCGCSRADEGAAAGDVAIIDCRLQPDVSGEAHSCWAKLSSSGVLCSGCIETMTGIAITDRGGPISPRNCWDDAVRTAAEAVGKSLVDSDCVTVGPAPQDA